MAGFFSNCKLSNSKLSNSKRFLISRFPSRFGQLFFASLLFLLFSCTVSGPTKVVVKEQGLRHGDFIEKLTCPVGRWNRPKVVVGKVVCKASRCQGGKPKSGGFFALLQLAGVPSFAGIGEGLRDMMQSILQQTNCFQVLNREVMEELRQEYALQGKKFKGPAADYIVTGAITSINFEKKHGVLGVVKLPGVGALSRTKTKAQLTMDIMVTDVKNASIIFSRTYSAESGKTTYGIVGGGYAGVGFGGAYSGLSGTAMEEVARDVLIRAAQDIAKLLVPENKIQVERIPVEKKGIMKKLGLRK